MICCICNKEFIPREKTCGKEECKKELHKIWVEKNKEERNEYNRLRRRQRFCITCKRPSVGFECKSCYGKKKK